MLDYTGAAFVFDATTGAMHQTLNSQTPAATTYFGTSVAVSGNMILVGAPYDSTTASRAGAAYLYDAATGALRATIADPPREYHDFLGQGVNLTHDFAVLASSSAVYVLELAPNVLSASASVAALNDNNVGSPPTAGVAVPSRTTRP